VAKGEARPGGKGDDRERSGRDSEGAIHERLLEIKDSTSVSGRRRAEGFSASIKKGWLAGRRHAQGAGNRELCGGNCAPAMSDAWRHYSGLGRALRRA
jgi:hypothetical protein